MYRMLVFLTANDGNLNYNSSSSNNRPLSDNGLAHRDEKPGFSFSRDSGVGGYTGRPSNDLAPSALRFVGVTGSSDTGSAFIGRLRVGVGDGVGYGFAAAIFLGVDCLRFFEVVIGVGGACVYVESAQSAAKSCISPAMNVSNTPSHSLPFGISRLTIITLGTFPRDWDCRALAISLTIRLTPGIDKLVPATSNKSTFPSFSPFFPEPFKSRSTADPINSP